MSAQISPDIAFTVVGLFNDPNEVFEKAKDYYGEELWKDAIAKASGDFSPSNNINSTQDEEVKSSTQSSATTL